MLEAEKYSGSRGLEWALKVTGHILTFVELTLELTTTTFHREF